jgi:hypothetical protein
MVRLGPWAVAAPGLRLQHRRSIVDSDIAGNRISSNPQKLQAILATVKTGHGSWRPASSWTQVDPLKKFLGPSILRLL